MEKNDEDQMVENGEDQTAEEPEEDFEELLAGIKQRNEAVRKARRTLNWHKPSWLRRR